MSRIVDRMNNYSKYDNSSSIASKRNLDELGLNAEENNAKSQMVALTLANFALSTQRKDMMERPYGFTFSMSGSNYLKPGQTCECVLTVTHIDNNIKEIENLLTNIGVVTNHPSSRVSVTKDIQNRQVTVVIQQCVAGVVELFFYDTRNPLLRSDMFRVDVSAKPVTNSSVRIFACKFSDGTKEYLCCTGYAERYYPNYINTSWSCGSLDISGYIHTAESTKRADGFYNTISAVIIPINSLPTSGTISFSVSHLNSPTKSVSINISEYV